jgi:hypothetical protein
MAASERDNRTLMAVVNCVFALRRKKKQCDQSGRHFAIWIIVSINFIKRQILDKFYKKN